MKKINRIMCFVVMFFVTTYASARSPWFAKGQYGISNVANQENNEQTTSDPTALWIEIGENFVKIVKSPQIYTPVFGEGESLDLSMKPVESANTVIEYQIVELKSVKDDLGKSNDICVLKNADGVECIMRAGIIGKTKDGEKVYAFNINDNQFKEIFWLFIDRDVTLYE